MDVSEVLADLIAEQEALDAVVAPLTAEQLALPTPSPRWTVADQLAHLTYFDGNAALAITDPDAFPATITALLESAAGGEEGMDDFTLGAWRSLPPAELLVAWRGNRALLAEAAATLANDTRIAWYGPSMGSKSFLTARLMEVWAHGQDIVDTVGATRPATDRLRHIADLGVRTRGFSYIVRGLEAPAGDVRVELTGPRGELWNWGDEHAPEWVMGTALDFCLVVTQRRHVDDTELAVMGAGANEWMVIAQCFAGGPTLGPAPTAGGAGGTPA